MKDKIIQITDTLSDESKGQTLGLSENGNLYILCRELVDDPTFRWELLIDSPKLIK